MIIPEEWGLRNMALNVQAQLNERTDAIKELGHSGPSGSLETLLEIGKRQGEPAEILQAVGSALAVLAHRGVHISEFDMRDLQGITYETFCEWEP